MIDHALQAAVQAAIQQAIAERGEIGIQVAAYHRGELVVDCWGGIADPLSGRKVDSDTLFNIFSVSKAIPSTAIHLQAERGLLDYDQPVVRYWPAFGANGKADITIREVLTHHSGTPQMPAGTDAATICDWDATVAAIADLAPILPKTVPAYQAMSFGWILGEVVRRTDPERRPFGRFVQEELCAPLGIDDLWLGIPDAADARIARLVDQASSRPAPEGSLFGQALPNAVRLIPDVFERPAVRRAAIPGVGGIATARGVAALFALIAGRGTLGGRRLLSEQRVLDACALRPGGAEPDPVYFDAPMTLSTGGYWKPSEGTPLTYPALGGPLSVCVPGAGASLGWADPDANLAIAFCHNRMMRPQRGEDHPATAIAAVIRTWVGLA